MKNLLFLIFLFLLIGSCLPPVVDENYQPINMGPNINTRGSDYAPFISADGKTIYFSRIDRRGENSDIYFSKLMEDGNFSKAINIGEPINTAEYSEIIVNVTPDGNTILLNKWSKQSSNNRMSPLYISNKIKKGWSTPKPVNIRDWDFDISEQRGEGALYSLGSDGKTLIIGVRRLEGFGNKDLWVSFKENNNNFSKPVNLGNVINTKRLEYASCLAPDMKTLYFSSNGHGGFGGRDIFKSTRLDDTWKNWSTPENLGSTINTKDDEFYYSVSSIGDYAFVAKDKSDWYKLSRFCLSCGMIDIYKIPLTENAKPKPVVLVSGKVIDSKNNEFVNADIMYEDLATGEKLGIANSNPDDGNYLIVLPGGGVYGFMAEVPGYYPISENIDLSDITENSNLKKDLYLNPLEKGSIIKLNNLFFEFNQFTLKPESFSELNRLAKLVNKSNTMELQINGHTDNVGEEDYNLQLSKNRANEVKEYLVKNGLSEKQIKTKGYGSEKPLATNDTEKGRLENRRVEFIILKK